MAVAHKGSISMGLVLIPIGMYKATVDNDIHFNQLDRRAKPGLNIRSIAATVGRKCPAPILLRATSMKKGSMW